MARRVQAGCGLLEQKCTGLLQLIPIHLILSYSSHRTDIRPCPTSPFVLFSCNVSPVTKDCKKGRNQGLFCYLMISLSRVEMLLRIYLMFCPFVNFL